ncbi:MAG TPA: class I SAM-dependent methyltransferase [Euzebyales bacterium]|nr:class I SAM-dependent methyltransferase [Euzebyales bacterium]
MGDSRIPPRLRWVCEALAVEPADRLLEVGCGRGAAVAAICERLTEGSVVAIDRSPVAITAAEQVNAEHIRAGRAAFQQAELAAVALDGQRFDKVFAVNVNLFWVRAARRELAIIDRLLEPGGGLHLFYGYGRPGPGRSGEVVDKLTANLSSGGFAIVDVVWPSAASSHMLHVAAQARPTG